MNKLNLRNRKAVNYIFNDIQYSLHVCSGIKLCKENISQLFFSSICFQKMSIPFHKKRKLISFRWILLPPAFGCQYLNNAVSAISQNTYQTPRKLAVFYLSSEMSQSTWVKTTYWYIAAKTLKLLNPTNYIKHYQLSPHNPYILFF